MLLVGYLLIGALFALLVNWMAGGNLFEGILEETAFVAFWPIPAGMLITAGILILFYLLVGWLLTVSDWVKMKIRDK